MAELSDIRPGGQYEPPKMKPLNGAQWQQPALFNAKPDDANRYPRGYTPERMHRVDRLFPPVTVQPQTRESYWVKSQANAKPRSLGEQALGGLDDNLIQIARNRMVDTVSRSTINTNDLVDIRRVSVAPAGTHTGPPRNAAGSYDGVHQTVQLGTGGVDSENTLIHEIGHHADRSDNYKRFFSLLRGSKSGAVPELEGFAVGYAHQHTPRREGNSMESLSYGQFHSKPAFKEHFERAAGGTTVKEAQAEVDASKMTAYKGTHGVPQPKQQLHLFGRGADVYETETQVDHGQWELRNFTTERETPLDTMRFGAGPPAEVHDRLRPGVTPKNYEVGKVIHESLHDTDSALRHAYGEGQPNLRGPKHPGWPK